MLAPSIAQPQSPSPFDPVYPFGVIDRDSRRRLPGHVAPLMVSDEAHDLPTGLIALMAVACGLSVAGLYYAQPLAVPIGLNLRLHQAAVGLLVTVAQLGYVAGPAAMINS